MSEISVTHAPDQPDSPGTKAGKFLARRGVLLLKEFREIGKMVDNYGAKMIMKTFIVSIAKSSTTKPDITYSVCLEQANDRQEASALMDYEEVEELDKALQYIGKLAVRLSNEKRDYTEVICRTKDSVQFGFYQQKNGSQQAFINLNSRSHFFVPIPAFEDFRELLGQASAHLASRGASAAS
jgi:hypothetical protein